MKKRAIIFKTVRESSRRSRRLSSLQLAGLWTLIAAVLVLSSCSRDEPGDDPGDLVAVQFGASLDGAFPTRTTNGGDNWEAGDQVGLFMVIAGSSNIPGNIPTVGGTTADNIVYEVTRETPASSASLSPAPDEPTVYYPQDGSPVDFIAYYPYTGTSGTGPGQIEDYKYYLTVAGQTTEAAQNALDVLYAKTNGVTKSRTAVNLGFGHVLSKVTFNIRAGEGIMVADIENMTASEVTLAGMPLTGSLDLTDGTLTAGTDLSKTLNPLRSAIVTTGYQVTFSALLVPQTVNYSGRTVSFMAGGEKLEWDIPETETFLAGEHYTYPVTVTRNGVTVGSPQITPWTQNDNTAGSGEATRMGIYSPQDLVAFSEEWNQTGSITNAFDRAAAQKAMIDKWAHPDGTVYIGADLDMSGVGNFIPIGFDASATTFTKSLDGRGHTISNLTVNIAGDYAGLFGHITGGQVRNIKIKDCNISGKNRVGGIAGENIIGTISGCEMISGTVTATEYYSGGITGYNNTGTITDCEISGGTVEAIKYYAGGIAGWNHGNTSEIESCRVTGSPLIKADHRAGGITGHHSSGTISGCEMSGGTVTVTKNYAGGIAGLNNGTITVCGISGGKVMAGDLCSGGIAGHISTAVAQIENCTVSGDPQISAEERAGGIVGYNDGATVRDCTVSGGTVNSTQYSGGIVGYTYNGATVVDCEISGGTISARISSGGIVGWNSGAASRIEICRVSGNPTILATNRAGGIAGYNDAGPISACRVTGGTVTGNSHTAGGIAGNQYNNGRVTSCIAAPQAVDGGYNLGVVIGTNNQGTITQCHWATKLVASNPATGGGTPESAGGSFDRSDVQNYFTQQVIEAMNEALEQAGSDRRWSVGTVESGWWPIAN